MAVFRDNFVRKFDLLGFTLFAPAAIQLLLALQYGGNQYEWNSATVIGLFCGSGATFIVFFIWEWYEGDNAMIPLRIISRRIVWTSCVLAMMFFGMTMVLAYYLPIYFQSVRGRTAIMSGVDMLPNVLAQLIAAVGSGVLSKPFFHEKTYMHVGIYMTNDCQWAKSATTSPGPSSGLS